MFFLSICSNWASPANLQILAEASVISDSYPLDYQAIPDTIEVYVNGVPIIGTWEYDASIQSVIFYEGMAPIEGDTIRIVYSIPMIVRFNIIEISKVGSFFLSPKMNSNIRY